MNPNQVLLQVRATLFIPRFLGYSAENIAKYQHLLPNAVVGGVELKGFPFPDAFPPVLGDNSPWQLSTESYQISFLPNRIDVSSVGVAADNALRKIDFVQTVEEIFRKIMELEGVRATRLAFAPSYAWNDTPDFHGVEYLNSLITRNRYEGVAADENEVRNRFLVDRRIGGYDTPVNHIISISSGTRHNRKGNAAEEFTTVICEIDINNCLGQSVQFTGEDVISFYNQVLDWEQSLINVYL
jgi:hypothetical protein